MQRMTIAGAFGAMFEFIGSSWYVILGSLLSVLIVSVGLSFALIGGSLGTEPDAGALAGFFLISLIGYVLLFACQFLSWRHGLARGQESVVSNIGWAIGAGALSLLSMFVAGFIITIAFYAVMAVVLLIFAALFGLSSLASANAFSPDSLAGLGIGAIFAFVLFYIALIVGYLWLYGRLMAAGPVMAVLRTVNPITGLAESWRLTGPSQWTIVGFQLILMVIAIVLMFGVTLVFGGVIAGLSGGVGGAPSETGLGVGFVLLAFAVYIPLILAAVAIPAAVYRQVSGGERYSAEIFT